MTHEEFMNMYNTELRHAWAPNPDSPNYKKQKAREKEYNHEYYLKNKDKWTKSDNSDYWKERIESVDTARDDYLEKVAYENEMHDKASKMALDVFYQMAKDARTEAEYNARATAAIRNASNAQEKRRLENVKAIADKAFKDLQSQAVSNAQAQAASRANERARERTRQTNVQNLARQARINTLHNYENQAQAQAASRANERARERTRQTNVQNLAKKAFNSIRISDAINDYKSTYKAGLDFIESVLRKSK